MSAIHPSASVAVTLSTSRTEPRALGRLAAQIAEVVAQLDGGAASAVDRGEWLRERASSDARLQAAVGECVASIEQCLELARAADELDDLAVHARDDLRRLGRLLTIVDRADVPFVLRQLRRVLGRLDGAEAPLAA